MNFMRRLRDQEHPAADQDDVAPGKFGAFTVITGSVRPISHTSTLSSMMRKHQRQQQADLAGALRLLLRNARDDHRNENDVVDAEHDLQRRQCQQRAQASGLVNSSIML